MGARGTRTKPPRVVRAAAVGATVAILATGGWTMASAAPSLPLPTPELPVPGQTYVTPDDLHGFGSDDDRGTGSRDFSDELGAPPMGNADALVLKTPENGDKVQFLTAELAGPLETFLSSSYYAQRAATSTGSDIQFPSFQIPVDKNGGALESGDFSTLTFEPVYQVVQNTASGSWNKYDTGTGLFCSTRQIGGFEANQTQCSNGGTKTLEQIIADNPGITALAAGVNQGSGNPGIVSGVDLIQVGSTTYNFERKAPLPPVVPEPENPGCEPKPHDPGHGHGMPDGEQPGHPHPGDGGHPDGMQGGGDKGGEDPKSEDPKSHPKPEHPKGEHPKGDHPGGEHPEGPHGGGHPDGPKPPTCES